MSDVAIAAPEHTSERPQRAKRERLSRQLSQVLDLLATGKCATQRAAAERAGLTEHHVSRMLQRPQIRALIAQRARQTVATAALRAAHRVAELIDADSEHVSLDASKWTLATEGIKPAETPSIINAISVTPGYVLDLGAVARDMPHILDGDAKPLTQHDKPDGE